MRQRWLFAVTTSAVVIGATGVSTQGGSSPSSRPFSGLFWSPVPAPTTAVPLVPPPENPMSAAPIDLSPRTMTTPSPAVRPVDCHLIVVPADPRIDPHMSIVAPDSQRFAMREPMSPICR